MEHRNASAAVIGAGDFIGAAIADLRRRGLLRLRRPPQRRQTRTAEGRDRGRRRPLRRAAVDARQEEDRSPPSWGNAEAAPLEVCIFNVGANVNFPILETTERVFRKVWEMACYGGFLTGREAARLMLPRGRGAIFFTGATASMRGGAGYAAFAAPSSGCAPWRRARRASLGRRTSTSRTWSSTAGVDTAWVRERIRPRGRRRRWKNLDPDG